MTNHWRVVTSIASAWLLGALTPAAAQEGGAGAHAVLSTSNDHRARAYEILRAHQVGDGDNGWGQASQVTAECAGMVQLLGASSKLMQALPKEEQDPDSFLSSFGSREPECTPEREKECAEWIQQLRRAGAFERLDALCAAKVFIAPADDTPLSLQTWPVLGTCRVCARVSAARMRAALETHDIEEYRRAVETTLALGRVTSGVPAIIGGLVGHSIQSMAFRLVVHDVIAGRLPLGACAEISRAMARQPLPDMGVALEVERESTLDTIDAFYDSLHTQGEGRKPAWAAQLAENAAQATIGTREAAASLMNRWMDAGIDMLSPDAAVRNRAEQTLSSLERAAQDPADPQYTRITEILLPAIDNMRRTDRRFRTQRDGVLVMLALERYRGEKNAYPDSLEPLVPHFLPAVPRDPFKPEVSLAYKRIDPKADPLGRGYLLYSVGSDGEDNGRKRSSGVNANGAGQGPSSVGIDYIVNEMDW